MLPVILGGIAMAAVGMKLLDLHDEVEYLKDQLDQTDRQSDTHEESYDGTNHIETLNTLRAKTLSATLEPLLDNEAIVKQLQSVGFELSLPVVETEELHREPDAKEKKTIERYSTLLQQISNSVDEHKESSKSSDLLAIYSHLLVMLLDITLTYGYDELSDSIEEVTHQVMALLFDLNSNPTQSYGEFSQSL